MFETLKELDLKSRKNPLYMDSRQDYVNILSLFKINSIRLILTCADISEFLSKLYKIPPQNTYQKLRRLHTLGYLKRLGMTNCSWEYTLKFNAKNYVIEDISPRSSTKTVYREPLPTYLRHKILKRDKYKCVECGATKDETTLTIDHIKPLALGGTNDESNLQTLCFVCNNHKSDRLWQKEDTKGFSK